MATREEVIAQIVALTNQRHGGDPRRLFDTYDGNRDGAVTRDELTRLLADAGVGVRVTRWSLIAPAIIDALDKNNNDRIEWAEFEAALKAG